MATRYTRRHTLSALSFELQTRRGFLTTAAMASAASMLGAPRVPAGDGALETTTVRFGKGSLCAAPTYLTQELLAAEGFTNVQYQDLSKFSTADTGRAVSRGHVDFSQGYASQFIQAIEAGEPVTLLAGIHVGCIELFANEGIRGITDLRGRSVGVQALGSTPHVLLTLMAASWVLTP